MRTQRRRRNRVNVFLDGQYAFGLDAAEAARLEVGQWLADDQISELRETDRLRTVYNRALRFLSYRPRSVEEVRRNLTEGGFAQSAVEVTLRRLEDASLLNDMDFARYWVEQRRDFRPRSIAMLRHELWQKGVPSEVVSAVLDDLDEEELAYEAARRFAGKLGPLPEEEFKRKLASRLARRGFPYSAIESALMRLPGSLDARRDQQGND